MRGMTRIAVAALLAAAPIVTTVAGSPAVARGADVVRTGSCSAASEWKLKLSPDDGRIEVEFEVDQNVVGDTWRVRFVRNGEVFARARATTTAPSGSFDITRRAADGPGTDRFRVRATNVDTAETCVGAARI